MNRPRLGRRISTREPTAPPSPRALAVARSVSGAPDPSVDALGSGVDHTAHVVAGRWVLRERLHLSPDTAGEIERERRLLELLSAVCPVPVPRPVAADPGAGVLVVELLRGTPLIDVPSTPVAALLTPLTAVLRALAGIERSTVAELVEADLEPMSVFREEVAALADAVAPALRIDQRRAVDRFLRGGVPDQPGPHLLSLCHHDLGAEHILVSADGSVTGVIDWSDAAWTDPARDLGRIARDLGRHAATQIAQAVHPLDAGLPARLRFHARCSLIEDLAHGLATGDDRYRDAASASFDRTFAD